MGQLTWFRLYHEARNDAKLRALTDAQFRVWFNLLCLASEQKTERGTIRDYPDDLLAIEVSGGDIDLLRATVDRLTALRIVTRDEQAITFSNFKRRQYDKESDYPEHVRERVVRYRAKKQEEPPEPPVTPPATVKRAVTRRNAAKRIDTDTDTEKSRSDRTSDLNGKGDQPIEIARPADATARSRPRDELWESLLAAMECQPGTDIERKSWNAALGQLKKAQATPAELRVRADRYVLKYDRKRLTPFALVRHWGELDHDLPAEGGSLNGTPQRRPAKTAEEVATEEAAAAERTADSRRWASELVRKLAGGDAAS